MVTTLRTLSYPALVALGLWTAACRPMSTCVPDVEPGRTYRVTLLEAYDENASVLYEPDLVPTGAFWPSCGGRDGITVGERMEFTTTRNPDEADDLPMCRVPYATISPREDFEIEHYGFFGYSANHLAFAVSNARVRLADGCTGLLRLTPFILQKELFAEPVPGERPPVLLQREFIPDTTTNPNCPRPQDPQGSSICADVWVARLEAL
jgi:hypothetical protein